MATSIPPRTKPYPNTGDLSAEEFDDAMNRWFEEQPDREEAMNQIAQEIEKYALNAEAAAGELDNAVWVSGTTYAAGQVRYALLISSITAARPMAQARPTRVSIRQTGLY